MFPMYLVWTIVIGILAGWLAGQDHARQRVWNSCGPAAGNRRGFPRRLCLLIFRFGCLRFGWPADCGVGRRVAVAFPRSRFEEGLID